MRKRLNRLNLYVFVAALALAGVAATARADLAGRWNFDDNTADDSSGNGLNGVLEGTAAIVNDSERGLVLELDGAVANYVSIDDSGGLLNFGGGSATVAAWVRGPAGQTDWKNHSAIFSQGEWRDGASLTIKGDTSPDGLLWTDGTDTNNSAFSIDPVPHDEWAHVAVVFSYDGSDLTRTFYVNGVFSGSSTVVGQDLDDELGGLSRIGLEDRNADGSGARWAFEGRIDDVQVFNEALTEAQILEVMVGITTKAHDPSPANEATLVSTTGTILSWEVPDDPNDEVVTYDVYFGTTVPDGNCDGPPLVSADQAATTYDPGTLAFDTDYYWRVDVIDPNGGGTPIIVKGDCWTFKTAPETVLITVQPVGLTVDAGATAEFSVTALNTTIYQWKKDGVDLSDGGKISGATTDTLTITDVQLAEEGNYSCVVDNALNMPETSSQVQLFTCRLVGHWKLDGNLLDSVQDTVPGAPTHDGTVTDANSAGEAYDTGIDGQAFSFTGDPNANVIEITDSTDYFNFFPRGLTVSAWLNDPTANGYNGLVSKQEECCNTVATGWTLEIDSGQDPVFTIRSVGGSGGATDAGTGVWHMVTGTYDPSTGVRRYYLDGALDDEDTSGSSPVASNGPVIFGAEDNGGTDGLVEVVYDGLLDDVRIYSCPLTAVEVATLYTDIAGGTLCVDAPADFGEFDHNGDCIIDVLDFASFAGQFLECYRIPLSACN